MNIFVYTKIAVAHMVSLFLCLSTFHVHTKIAVAHMFSLFSYLSTFIMNLCACTKIKFCAYENSRGCIGLVIFVLVNFYYEIVYTQTKMYENIL